MNLDFLRGLYRVSYRLTVEGSSGVNVELLVPPSGPAAELDIDDLSRFPVATVIVCAALAKSHRLWAGAPLVRERGLGRVPGTPYTYLPRIGVPGTGTPYLSPPHDLATHP